MKVSKFFVVLLVLFGIAAVIYAVSTPSTKYIQLTGIVTGTDEIVSPLIQGRLSRLLVDEGSEVKAGQLIAEIDPTEFKAQRDAAADNIRTLQARLQQSTVTQSMDAAQTSAAVQQAEASVTAAKAQLDQARATISSTKSLTSATKRSSRSM